MNEKGGRLTIYHQQSVTAQKGAKRIHIIAPEHAENVTVVRCINAIGNYIRPMIIFKGKSLKPEFDDNFSLDSLVHITAKGSITTELFTYFIRHFAHYKTEGRVLLIFADKHHINLLCPLSEIY